MSTVNGIKHLCQKRVSTRSIIARTQTTVPAVSYVENMATPYGQNQLLEERNEKKKQSLHLQNLTVFFLLSHPEDYCMRGKQNFIVLSKYVSFPSP